MWEWAVGESPHLHPFSCSSPRVLSVCCAYNPGLFFLYVFIFIYLFIVPIPPTLVATHCNTAAKQLLLLLLLALCWTVFLRSDRRKKRKLCFYLKPPARASYTSKPTTKNKNRKRKTKNDLSPPSHNEWPIVKRLVPTRTHVVPFKSGYLLLLL